MNEHVQNVRTYLSAGIFTAAEHTLMRSESWKAVAFRYPSGVEAVRLETDRISLVWLPFQGQQVWRFAVDGEDLTMRTQFDEPTASGTFGESYGAFLLHCGLSGMGHPGPDDIHPHHGELPRACYQSAWIEAGSDDQGPWVALAGTFTFRVSHSYHYDFTPRLVMRPGRSTLDLGSTIENHRASPLGYSYLCHINWPIWAGARLAQTVPMDADHVVWAPDPGQDAETAHYMHEIAQRPSDSNQLDPSMHLIPEYCALLTPRTDSTGRAHFLQARPDGRAALVSYETAALPHAVRWISNTGDESAAGFCLPSTGHHHGRKRSEDDGMIQYVPGHGSVDLGPVSFGLLDRPEATRTMLLIDQVLRSD